jgi:hypothetical protein
LPVFLLNSKGDTEIALKQREGSALRYRYLRLFGIPVIPISESFIADGHTQTKQKNRVEAFVASTPYYIKNN